MVFYDFSWIAKRTTTWDAVGVGAYALVIALIESLALFIISVFLSFLLPKKWSETQRIVLMGSLGILISLWGILGQLYFIVDNHSTASQAGAGWQPASSVDNIRAFLVSGAVIHLVTAVWGMAI